MTALLARLLRRTGKVEERETALVLGAAAYFFFLLSGYFILRPLREQMGLAGGVKNVHWLFLVTLLVMLLLNPVYGRVVSRTPRERFIPRAYRFFIANLLVFFALLQVLPESGHVWVGRVFYVWVSVFNLFAVSIFWQYMADNFESAQAKRLYAYIGIGGTLGAVAGSLFTAGVLWVADAVGMRDRGALVPYFLLISALLLECAVRCFLRLVDGFRRQQSAGPATTEPAAQGLGGGSFDGLVQVVRSPYMLGICSYLFLYSLSSTFLYFVQMEVVSDFALDGGTRTAVFAWINVADQSMTLLLQMFVTSRLIAAVGLGRSLAVLPLITLVGCAVLTVAPVLGVFIVVQVLRRASRFGISKPAQEVLFNSLDRSEKYKAKSVADTFVYRSGDATGALVRWLTQSVTAMAFLGVPLAVGWIVASLWLGRAQGRRERPHASS